jgi:hypothetical protein
MGSNLRRGGANCGVVRFHAFERLVFRIPFEERGFQLVQLARHVVVLMERCIGEDCREHAFRQNVLDQHLAHVSFAEARIDRFLSVFEKFFCGFSKFGFAIMSALDHGAQRFEHHRQIGFELLDGLAELGDLGPLVFEEKIEQFFQVFDIVNGAAVNLLFFLNQNRPGGILEDDVVLGITTAQFGGDLCVEVILLVFCFPNGTRSV